MQHLTSDKIKIAETVANAVALGSSDVSPRLNCAIISKSHDVLVLEDEWRALESVCPDTTLFQSFDWCRNYLEFREETNRDGMALKPVIITIRLDGKLVGLMPLVLQPKGKMTVLTGFSEPFQQYTEILLDKTVNPSEARKMFLSALNSTGADYFHFGQVRQDGKLAQLLEGIVLPSGEQDAAPFVQVADFANYEAYLKTIRSKTRKNLRNARNRLERDAPVVHETARRGELMQQVVDRAYEGREAWLERLGITSRAFRDDDFEAFLKRCADDTKAQGVDTIAMSLKHGDTVISDQWGFVYRGRYYAFMATWNLEYEACSPGRLHLGEVIKACFDEGFGTADFMIPASSYKLTWTADAAPVQDYVLGISVKGKLYTKLWLDLMRPLSKKIFFKLPASLRGLLVKNVLPSVE